MSAPVVEARHEYLAKGWEVLLLPPGLKGPPMKGTTGYAGKALSPRALDRLAGMKPLANLGLRLPEGVVGIDLDAYHGGRETLDSLEADLGPLPASPSISSRSDGSGVRFYRVASGTRLRGSMGLGVDVIQRHHRYAVAGVHPSGRPYLWDSGSAPSVEDLPELPAAWAQRFEAQP